MRRIWILTTVTVVSMSLPALLVEAQHSPKKSTQTAQKTSTYMLEKELRDLYEKLLLATKTKNEAILQQVLADKYSQVTADGRVRTKPIRIQETMSQDEKTELLNLESFDVFIYKNAAVARCLVRNKGIFRGEAFDQKILSTATFIKEDKGWQIAATHLSFVKAPL